MIDKRARRTLREFAELPARASASIAAPIVRAIQPRFQRVFLVGCPRSGTTLLQALLAGHPSISTFPESHFFQAWRPRGHLDRVLDRAPPTSRDALTEYFASFDVAPWTRFGRRLRWRPSVVAGFIHALDTIAQRQGSTVWVEKTPSHLEHIEEITRWVRGARFVHIVRSGVDVVASLYQVTHEHSQVWGTPRSIDACCDRWLRSVEISARYSTVRGHILVQYENIVAHPARELQRLCAFLGVSYTAEMLNTHHQGVRDLVTAEPWKSKVLEPLALTPGRKFRKVFSEEDQNKILRILKAARSRYPSVWEPNRKGTRNP